MGLLFLLANMKDRRRGEIMNDDTYDEMYMDERPWPIRSIHAYSFTEGILPWSNFLAISVRSNSTTDCNDV